MSSEFVLVTSLIFEHQKLPLHRWLSKSPPSSSSPSPPMTSHLCSLMLHRGWWRFSLSDYMTQPWCDLTEVSAVRCSHVGVSHFKSESPWAPVALTTRKHKQYMTHGLKKKKKDSQISLQIPARLTKQLSDTQTCTEQVWEYEQFIVAWSCTAITHGCILVWYSEHYYTSPAVNI